MQWGSISLAKLTGLEHSLLTSRDFSCTVNKGPVQEDGEEADRL